MSKELITLDFEERAVRMTVDDNNKPWWVARDVCAILDLTWSGATLEPIPDKNKGMSNFNTPGGPQKLTCVDRSGMIRLIARSNKPEAERFQDWVFDEVLPSVLDTGKYDIHQPTPLALPEHLKRDTQLSQSKTIGGRLYYKQGREGLMQYYIDSLTLKTGMTPAELKKAGKLAVLKSKQRSSRREVVRNVYPALGAEVSLMDNVYLRLGVSVDQAHQISESARPFFTKVLEMGFSPEILEQLAPPVS